MIFKNREIISENGGNWETNKSIFSLNNLFDLKKKALFTLNVFKNL